MTIYPKQTQKEKGGASRRLSLFGKNFCIATLECRIKTLPL